MPRRNSIPDSQPVTNGHPKKTTRSTANTERSEPEKADLDQTRTIISKSNNHPEPRENQENEVDLESMTNDQLADFMRKIGLRFASIDSRNRPNYYKRIRQKLGEKQKETYQEFRNGIYYFIFNSEFFTTRWSNDPDALLVQNFTGTSGLKLRIQTI